MHGESVMQCRNWHDISIFFDVSNQMSDIFFIIKKLQISKYVLQKLILNRKKCHFWGMIAFETYIEFQVNLPILTCCAQCIYIDGKRAKSDVALGNTIIPS